MLKSDNDMPSGWVEAQLPLMEQEGRLDALAKVRNRMRTFEPMPADLELVPVTKRGGRPR